MLSSRLFVHCASLLLPQGNHALRILVDNSFVSTHLSSRCELLNLEPGYHLLRAFIVAPQPVPFCLKTAMACVHYPFCCALYMDSTLTFPRAPSYVEAEFHVKHLDEVPRPRCGRGVRLPPADDSVC